MSMCLRAEGNKLFLSPCRDPVLFQTRSVVGEGHNRYYNRNNTLNADNSRNYGSLRSRVNRSLLTSYYLYFSTQAMLKLSQNGKGYFLTLTESGMHFLTYNYKAWNDHVEKEEQRSPSDLHSISNVRVRCITADVLQQISLTWDSNQLPFSVFSESFQVCLSGFLH